MTDCDDDEAVDGSDYESHDAGPDNPEPDTTVQLPVLEDSPRLPLIEDVPTQVWQRCGATDGIDWWADSVYECAVCHTCSNCSFNNLGVITCACTYCKEQARLEKEMAERQLELDAAKSDVSSSSSSPGDDTDNDEHDREEYEPESKRHRL